MNFPIIIMLIFDVVWAYIQSTFPSSFSYFLGTEGYNAAVRDFQGRIAMCLMYNRQLSAAEHAKNYNALKQRFGLT